MPWFSALWANLRLSIYRLLSAPHPVQHHVRLFRFGLPFVLKTTRRIQSTEADALRYLNTQFQGTHRLPIPRVYDSLVVDHCTYTLMSRIPGDNLLSVCEDMTRPEMDMICSEIEDVMRRVWTLKQPAHFAGKFCISASGHGILASYTRHSSLIGPFRSKTDYYLFVTGMWNDVDDFLATLTPLSPYGDPRAVYDADSLVFSHTDLRMHNVMVKNGHLTGIVDWELSAWLPMERQWSTLKFDGPFSRGYWHNYWKEMDVTPATANAHNLTRIAWNTIHTRLRLALKKATDSPSCALAVAQGTNPARSTLRPL